MCAQHAENVNQKAIFGTETCQFGADRAVGDLEQIVDAPVPQVMEEFVEFVDVLVLVVLEEIVEVARLIPHERLQIVDVPIPHGRRVFARLLSFDERRV